MPLVYEILGSLFHSRGLGFGRSVHGGIGRNGGRVQRHDTTLHLALGAKDELRDGSPGWADRAAGRSRVVRGRAPASPIWSGPGRRARLVLRLGRDSDGTGTGTRRSGLGPGRNDEGRGFGPRRAGVDGLADGPGPASSSRRSRSSVPRGFVALLARSPFALSSVLAGLTASGTEPAPASPLGEGGRRAAWFPARSRRFSGPGPNPFGASRDIISWKGKAPTCTQPWGS